MLVNPTASWNRVTVLLRPCPNLRGVTITLSSCCSSGFGSFICLNSACFIDERANSITELCCVLFGEIYLVEFTVESEADGLFCGFSGEVVFEDDVYFLSHEVSPISPLRAERTLKVLLCINLIPLVEETNKTIRSTQSPTLRLLLLISSDEVLRFPGYYPADKSI